MKRKQVEWMKLLSRRVQRNKHSKYKTHDWLYLKITWVKPKKKKKTVL